MSLVIQQYLRRIFDNLIRWQSGKRVWILRAASFTFLLMFMLANAEESFAQVCAQRRNISLFLAIDISSSMDGAKLFAARNFAVDIINELNATGHLDEASSIQFCSEIVANNQWMNPTDLQSGLANLAITCANPQLSFIDGTSLYSAIVVGANALKTRSPSNIRLLVVITDGEDTTSIATAADAANALSGGSIVSRLVFIGSGDTAGSIALASIASAADSNSQAMAASASNLSSLVANIRDATCTNFRPDAAMSLSSSALRLGVDGFSIDFDGSGSHDVETSDSGLNFSWTFTRPDDTTFTRTGMSFSQTFDDSQLPNGEQWTVSLRVTDPSGASDTVTRGFRVIGSPPDITLAGTTSIDVLKEISLQVMPPISDIDGGGNYSVIWDLLQTPPNASRGPQSGYASGSSVSFVTVESDIGVWVFRATATDNEGDSDTKEISSTVKNIPPSINIQGPTEVSEGESIDLQVTPTEDADGGTYEIKWDIQGPPGAQAQPITSGTAGEMVHLEVGGGPDIGTWTFRATATDNEGDSDTKELPVEVKNVPPDIELVGEPMIVAGGTIILQTTIIEDAHGDDLSFRWDIVQAPQSSSPTVQEGYATGKGTAGASLSIDTTPSDAGTWIFRLTATDDDLQPDSSKSEEKTVLVDGLPVATISGEGIHDTVLPIVLDGTGSVDPDSPCPDQPQRCHTTLDGIPVAAISPGLSYSWFLVDVPSEFAGSYPMGSVDEIIGAFAHGEKLEIPSDSLSSGKWTFRLEVEDGEGNTDAAESQVSLIDQHSLPVAVASPPNRYVVNDLGVVGQDISLSALGSHDPDNAYQSDASGEGDISSLGITDYQWEVIDAPANCVLPILESGPSSYFVTLYPAGTAVDPGCLGIWRIRLTVTDDDTPALTKSVETLIGIGNCPQALCIDYPTATNPLRIEFTDSTDVFVYYHVDSVLLDAPELRGGALVQLNIYYDNDLTTPVYTAVEPNVLASDRGGQLVFHWNGYTNDFQRPREGKYTLRATLISLADAIPDSVLGASIEANAIWIATAEPRILESSDQNVSVEALANGDDHVDLKYQIEGNVVPDELHWRVYDDNGNLVVENRMPPEPTGSISWSGRNFDGSIVDPGIYVVQLQLFRQGVDVGNSEPYAFMIFLTSIHWGNPLETWDRVLGSNDELRLYIKTTPKQLTVSEILQTGFPLTLHSRFTFPFGQRITIFSSTNGATSAKVLLPSGTTSVIPSTANIADKPQGIEFSFANSMNLSTDGEQDSTDEFASSDWVKDINRSNYNDSDAFIAAMMVKRWREVGTARESGDYDSLRAAANRQFIIHAGTETIWFSIWGKESEKRQVRQQADWFYYSGHGQHSTGELLTPTGPISAAETLWRGDLDVVIIAGCSVLDIKDYRAKSFSVVSQSYWWWRAFGGASSPGEAWEKTGPKFLLGYAWKAPLDVQGSTEIINRFSLAVDNGNSIVEAWKIANDLPTGRNAVAIDTSKTPHEYCYWDERQGTPDWRCIQKTDNGWPEIP